jgi:hypothetical protein
MVVYSKTAKVWHVRCPERNRGQVPEYREVWP